MEITSTRQAAGAAQEAIASCPQCGSNMVVRAQWHNGHVQGLNWTCLRAPGCEGVRRVRNPDEVRPTVHNASTQAIFDWQSSHEHRLVPRREPAAAAGAPRGGFMGRLFGRPTAESDYDVDATPDHAPMGYFDGLVELGFVVLEDRSLPMARVVMDNVVIGPSGVFAVDCKAWVGHVATTGDAIYVDGRMRMGALDTVQRATEALEQTLAHELKPLGATVRPAILFEKASNKTVEAQVGKVLVGGTRGLPKLIRGNAEPILGPETVVRLALAADRLLE